MLRYLLDRSSANVIDEIAMRPALVWRLFRAMCASSSGWKRSGS
jgi:hypothetical protein